MKGNYEKYIKEVWQMKEKAYDDFKRSNSKTYVDFIKKELSQTKIPYRIKEKEPILV